eukprot:5231036-Amphidinium_carterae.1
MATTPEERRADIPLPPMIGEREDQSQVHTVESSSSNNSSSSTRNSTRASTIAMRREERKEEESYWENIVDIMY